MNLRKNIRKVVLEAMGVPDNIVALSRKLYDEMIGSLPENGDAIDLDGMTLRFKDKFNIADYHFKGVKFIFEIVEDSTMEIGGFSTRNLSRITKKFKIKTQVNHGVLEISILIGLPSNTSSKELKQYLIDNKVEVMGSTSHELKHYYDHFKKPKSNLSSRAKYVSLTTNKFASIHPLNEFMHYMYFIHQIENLVRPSEFAAALDAGEVSKKGFLEFLQNHVVYQRLKEIQNFTYQGLRNDLVDYLPRIKYVFDKNNIDYDGLNDDEIIDRVLEVFVENLQMWHIEAIEDRLIKNPLEKLFGMEGERKKFFDKFLNKVKMYGLNGPNVSEFFEKEEKKFNFVATDMIKKIAKLYDMAKDVKTESIINWELWQKVKGVNTKIVTEFKYPKKK